MKLYAFSLMATKYIDINQGSKVESCPGVLNALNENEALGLATEYARKKFLKQEGWTNQQASVVKIPAEMIAGCCCGYIQQPITSANENKGGNK